MPGTLRRRTGLQMIPAATAASRCVPWVAVAPQAPYFVTEHGEPWTPIGLNDAITWPDLCGLMHRRDLAGVELHLRWLRAWRDLLAADARILSTYRVLPRKPGRYVPSG